MALPSGMVFHENTGSAIAPAFAAGVTSPFGLAAFAQGFADLDGDGDLDGFGGSNGLLVFENTGSATSPAFAAALVNPFGLAGVGSSFAMPEVADVDGDGDPDAFVCDGHGRTVFFENVALGPGTCGTGSTTTATAPSRRPTRAARARPTRAKPRASSATTAPTTTATARSTGAATEAAIRTAPA